MDYLAEKTLPGGTVLKVGTWKSGFHKNIMCQLICSLDGFSDTRYPMPNKDGDNCTEDKIMALYDSIENVDDFMKLVEAYPRNRVRAGSV